jgi:hypothetical protein
VSRPTAERRDERGNTVLGCVRREIRPGGYPTNTLLESTGSTPESKPFRVYPVFSSRERADRFVWEQWQRLSQELIEQTAANIRQIRRDEIPAEHYVSLDHNDPVTWAKLLGEG